MIKINSAEITALGKKNSKTIRISIPAVIRDTMEIKQGDILKLECYINDKGEKKVILTKKEN